jgi:hypothetical protein
VGGRQDIERLTRYNCNFNFNCGCDGDESFATRDDASIFPSAVDRACRGRRGIGSQKELDDDVNTAANQPQSQGTC